MQIYHYHPETGNYLGASDAQPDPLELRKALNAALQAASKKATDEKKVFDPTSVKVDPSVFLIPAFATTSPPPGPSHGKIARFQGGNWTLAVVTDPQMVEAEVPAPTWDSVRGRRNGLLSESDWTQLPDAPVSLSDQDLWKVYRKGLRDLPENFKNPGDVVWPIPPVKR